MPTVAGLSHVTLQADSLRGDYRRVTRYYVGDLVVRRLKNEEGNPRGGELLECRQDK